MVVSAGDFRFYINRSLQVEERQYVHGRGVLLLDHYLWVEYLDRYHNPPDLFYQLLVERIRRIQIPESLISRYPKGKALPASLNPIAYDANTVTEIETMEGQEFDEEFYLLDLTDQGVGSPIARTFI